MQRPAAILATFLTVVFLPIAIFAQTYSFEFDPGTRAGIMEPGGFEVSLGGGMLENTGTNNDTYHISLDISLLPAGWDANFCAGSMCYPTEADIDVVSGRDSEVSVHVYPVGDGAAMLTLIVGSSHAGRADTVHYWASKNPTMVVVCDAEPELTVWFTNALGNLSESWGVIMRSEGDLSGEDLGDYNEVIWFTGADYTSVFTETDTVAIGEYLDNCGKFMLSSQGAASFCDDAGWTAFLSNRLKANWEGDDSSLTSIYGVPITVFDGILASFGCAGGPGSFDRPSMLAVSGGSVPVFQYEAVGSPIGGVGYYSESGYKLLYFGFPWEAISVEDTRDSVMAKSLEYLRGAGGIEDREALKPIGINVDAYPNPFNASANIEFEISKPGDCDLSIYDFTGLMITEIAFSELAAGRYSVVWSGKKSDGSIVPAGMYFARLRQNDSTTSTKLLFIK